MSESRPRVIARSPFEVSFRDLKRGDGEPGQVALFASSNLESESSSPRGDMAHQRHRLSASGAHSYLWPSRATMGKATGGGRPMNAPTPLPVTEKEANDFGLALFLRWRRGLYDELSSEKASCATLLHSKLVEMDKATGKLEKPSPLRTAIAMEILNLMCETSMAGKWTSVLTHIRDIVMESLYTSEQSFMADSMMTGLKTYQGDPLGFPVFPIHGQPRQGQQPTGLHQRNSGMFKSVRSLTPELMTYSPTPDHPLKSYYRPASSSLASTTQQSDSDDDDEEESRIPEALRSTVYKGSSVLEPIRAKRKKTRVGGESLEEGHDGTVRGYALHQLKDGRTERDLRGLLIMKKTYFEGLKAAIDEEERLPPEVRSRRKRMAIWVVKNSVKKWQTAVLSLVLQQWKKFTKTEVAFRKAQTATDFHHNKAGRYLLLSNVFHSWAGVTLRITFRKLRSEKSSVEDQMERYKKSIRSLSDQNHVLQGELNEERRRASNLNSDIERLQKDIDVRERHSIEDMARVMANGGAEVEFTIADMLDRVQKSSMSGAGVLQSMTTTADPYWLSSSSAAALTHLSDEQPTLLSLQGMNGETFLKYWVNYNLSASGFKERVSDIAEQCASGKVAWLVALVVWLNPSGKDITVNVTSSSDEDKEITVAVERLLPSLDTMGDQVKADAVLSCATAARFPLEKIAPEELLANRSYITAILAHLFVSFPARVPVTQRKFLISEPNSVYAERIREAIDRARAHLQVVKSEFIGHRRTVAAVLKFLLEEAETPEKLQSEALFSSLESSPDPHLRSHCDTLRSLKKRLAHDRDTLSAEVIQDAISDAISDFHFYSAYLIVLQLTDLVAVYTQGNHSLDALAGNFMLLREELDKVYADNDERWQLARWNPKKSAHVACAATSDVLFKGLQLIERDWRDLRFRGLLDQHDKNDEDGNNVSIPREVAVLLTDPQAAKSVRTRLLGVRKSAHLTFAALPVAEDVHNELQRKVTQLAIESAAKMRMEEENNGVLPSQRSSIPKKDFDLIANLLDVRVVDLLRGENHVAKEKELLLGVLRDNYVLLVDTFWQYCSTDEGMTRDDFLVFMKACKLKSPEFTPALIDRIFHHCNTESRGQVSSEKGRPRRASNGARMGQLEESMEVTAEDLEDVRLLPDEFIEATLRISMVEVLYDVTISRKYKRFCVEFLGEKACSSDYATFKQIARRGDVAHTLITHRVALASIFHRYSKGVEHRKEKYLSMEGLEAMLRDSELMAPAGAKGGEYAIESGDVQKIFLQVKRDSLQEHWNKVARAKRSLRMLPEGSPKGKKLAAVKEEEEGKEEEETMLLPMPGKRPAGGKGADIRLPPTITREQSTFFFETSVASADSDFRPPPDSMSFAEFSEFMCAAAFFFSPKILQLGERVRARSSSSGKVAVASRPPEKRRASLTVVPEGVSSSGSAAPKRSKGMEKLAAISKLSMSLNKMWKKEETNTVLRDAFSAFVPLSQRLRAMLDEYFIPRLKSVSHKRSEGGEGGEGSQRRFSFVAEEPTPTSGHRNDALPSSPMGNLGELSTPNPRRRRNSIAISHL